MRVWTIEEAKEELPIVKVKVGKEIHDGYLAGRQKKFPTVFYGPISQTVGKDQWSWKAIVHSLNTNTPLQV